jgi:cyclase
VTAKRLIARLDIKGPNVVRGVHLEGLRVVGQPAQLAQAYAEQGIDELIFIDTVASLYGRNQALEIVEHTAARAFIPLTVGGGLRALSDLEGVLRAGADKVCINSAAVKNPKLLVHAAKAFGRQCIVSAIDAKARPGGGWTVLIDNAREPTGLDAIDWAKEAVALGAGEVLLTSVDADGTRAGCDLELVKAVSRAVDVPVIASGGPGDPRHVVEAFVQGGADAVALGTLLHFGLATVQAVKTAMANAGLEVRLTLRSDR